MSRRIIKHGFLCSPEVLYKLELSMSLLAKSPLTLTENNQTIQNSVFRVVIIQALFFLGKQ